MINPAPKRIEKINQELVDVRNEFTSFVKELSEDNWERKIEGETWTIKEEMVHIANIALSLCF